MSTTVFGRPSKGRRPMSRLSIHASNLPAIAKLCSRHNRIRTEIVAALLVVGLDHPDELVTAMREWSRRPVDLPPEYASIPATPDEDVDASSIRVRLTELHHNAVEEYLAGPQLRSALVWVGLHHVDELPKVLAEIDILQHRMSTGGSLGDFYVDTIAEFCGDDPPSPGEALRAIRQLRAGESAAKVAKATGLPRKLLAAMSVEAISAIDGRLPLTG